MGSVENAILVLSNGVQLQVQLIPENLKTLNTYLRTNNVVQTLMSYTEKDKAVPRQLMIDDDLGKLFIKMPDNSIISPSTGAEDAFDEIKRTLIEVHDHEVKPSIAPKLFFKILKDPKVENLNYEEFYQYIEEEKAKNAVDRFEGVLTTYEFITTTDTEGNPVSIDQKRIIIPYTDIDYVLVPIFDSNGDRIDVMNLGEYLKKMSEEIDGLLDKVWEAIQNLRDNKEDKQTDGKKGDIAYSDSTLFNKFKIGLSIKRLVNDGAYSNGWRKVLNTLGVPVNQEAFLMTWKAEPRIIKDSGGNIIEDDTTSTTLFQQIIPVGNNGIRTYAERSVKYGETDVAFLYKNHTHLSDANVVHGDNGNARSIKVTSVLQCVNSGFYDYENTKPGVNDAPGYSAFQKLTKNGTRDTNPVSDEYIETKGKVYVATTSVKLSDNMWERTSHMIFISTTGYHYYTDRPLVTRVSIKNNSFTEEEISTVGLTAPRWERAIKSDELKAILNELQDAINKGFEKIQINDKINDITYEDSLKKETFKEGLSIRRLRTDSVWNTELRLYGISYPENCLLYTVRTPKVGSESDLLHQNLILKDPSGFTIRLERIIPGDGTDKKFNLLEDSRLDTTSVLAGDYGQGKSVLEDDITKIYESGIYTFSNGDSVATTYLPINPATKNPVTKGSIIANCKRTVRNSTTGSYLDEVNMYFISSEGVYVTDTAMQVIENRTNKDQIFPSNISLNRRPIWSKVITTSNATDLIKASNDTINIDVNGQISVNPQYIGMNKDWALDPTSQDGWYRIAKSLVGIHNLMGTYKLTISKSGYHDIIEFRVSATFNDISGVRTNLPKLDIIGRKHYKDTHIIQNMRLVYPPIGEETITSSSNIIYLDIYLNMRDTANGRFASIPKILVEKVGE